MKTDLNKCLAHWVAFLLVPCILSASPSFAELPQASISNQSTYSADSRTSAFLQQAIPQPSQFLHWILGARIGRHLAIGQVRATARRGNQSKSRLGRPRIRGISLIVAAGAIISSGLYYFNVIRLGNSGIPETQRIEAFTSSQKLNLSQARQLLATDWLAITKSEKPNKADKTVFREAIRKVLEAQGIDTTRVEIRIEPLTATLAERRTVMRTDFNKDFTKVILMINEMRCFGPNRAIEFEGHRFEDAIWHETYHMKSHPRIVALSDDIAGFMADKKGVTHYREDSTDQLYQNTRRQDRIKIERLLSAREEVDAMSYAMYIFKLVVREAPSADITHLRGVYVSYNIGLYKEILGEENRITDIEREALKKAGDSTLDYTDQFGPDNRITFKELFPNDPKFDPSAKPDNSDLTRVASLVKPIEIYFEEVNKTLQAYASLPSIDQLIAGIAQARRLGDRGEDYRSGKVTVERFQDGRWRRVDPQTRPLPGDRLRVKIGSASPKADLLHVPQLPGTHEQGQQLLEAA